MEVVCSIFLEMLALGEYLDVVLIFDPLSSMILRYNKCPRKKLESGLTGVGREMRTIV
jgi:hypothetical protein